MSITPGFARFFFSKGKSLIGFLGILGGVLDDFFDSEFFLEKFHFNACLIIQINISYHIYNKYIINKNISLHFHCKNYKTFLKQQLFDHVYSCFRRWCDANVHARTNFGRMYPPHQKFACNPLPRKIRNQKQGRKSLISRHQFKLTTSVQNPLQFLSFTRGGTRSQLLT